MGQPVAPQVEQLPDTDVTGQLVEHQVGQRRAAARHAADVQDPELARKATSADGSRAGKSPSFAEVVEVVPERRDPVRDTASAAGRPGPRQRATASWSARAQAVRRSASLRRPSSEVGGDRLARPRNSRHTGERGRGVADQLLVADDVDSAQRARASARKISWARTQCSSSGGEAGQRVRPTSGSRARPRPGAGPRRRTWPPGRAAARNRVMTRFGGDFSSSRRRSRSQCSAHWSSSRGRSQRVASGERSVRWERSSKAKRPAPPYCRAEG